jgi:phosphoribosylformimino-5-aminoimidazole carboxamide ribotide isomerase
MQIIPVLDLMCGQVVHAKQGLRDRYRPIESPLCATSEPLVVLSALLELYPFETLYIADIDAIRGLSHHGEIIKAITTQFPSLTIWLDKGRQVGELIANQIIPVIGTESLVQMSDYQNIATRPHVLSLDHQDNGPLGLNELHHSPTVWPDHVICMTLNAVGSSAGVDTAKLHEIQSRNQSRNAPSKLYAAGGVRNKADLQALADQGIAGVLVATALHRQTITAKDIATLT